MAWTTPRTWVAGELVTASLLNTQLRDNLSHLHDGMGIVSLQRGTITINGSTSNTATVTAVDTTKTLLDHLGEATDSAITAQVSTRLALTNSTTITATRNISNAVNTVVGYQLVEYAS